ncbi:MAG: hypothetical protein FWG47_00530 [Propionibacteriaceae bacterium]|nr:hypothetical protein [Propionibacteriaceae bacterium]
MLNVIVLMTALLPTTGHADLIKFAANLPGTEVWVLINTRSFEPIGHDERLNAFREHFAPVANAPP